MDAAVARSRHVSGVTSMWILVGVAYAVRARGGLPADLACVVVLCVIVCATSVRCYPRLGGPGGKAALALDCACARLLYVALLLHALPSRVPVLPWMPWVVLLAYAGSMARPRPEHNLLPHATFRYLGYWWVVITLCGAVPPYKEMVAHSLAYWGHVWCCVPGHYGTDCVGVLALGFGAAALGEAWQALS